MSEVAVAAAPAVTGDQSSVAGEGGNNASLPPVKAQQTEPANAELFEVKVNGKIVKMTRQQVLDSASMSHAANERFSEAKKTRAEVDKLLSKAKSNPIEALMDPSFGLSKEQIRDAMEKWYSKEFIEPESLSPQERRIKELEEQVELTRKEKEELAAAKQAEIEEKEDAQNRTYYQKQIIDAMEAHKIPKTEANAKRIAALMRQNLQNGWDAPMDFIIRQMKSERQGHFKEEFSSATIDELIDLLGEEKMNELRRHDLQKLREKKQMPPVQSGGSMSNSGIAHAERKKISMSDAEDRLRDIRLGKISY